MLPAQHVELRSRIKCTLFSFFNFDIDISFSYRQFVTQNVLFASMTKTLHDDLRQSSLARKIQINRIGLMFPLHKFYLTN